ADDPVPRMGPIRRIIHHVKKKLSERRNRRWKSRKSSTTKTTKDHWRLVFRQTVPYFFSADEWSKNPTDPESDNFAILDQLEDFRVNGALYFRQSWPTLGEEDQIWKQTSNPVTSTDGSVTGYEPISIASTGQFWGGLQYNGNQALLDGSSVDNSSNWWYSIGSHQIYAGGMPGPPGTIVDLVELWVSTIEVTATTTTTTTFIAAPPPQSPEGGTWQLVFRQTVPQFYAPGELSKNENADPNSVSDFSILDQLDSFNVDGVFYFLLRWPGSGEADQIWRQTSNPVTTVDGSVTGY
ncbi:ADS3, partial [Symbiodinium pilosum]